MSSPLLIGIQLGNSAAKIGIHKQGSKQPELIANEDGEHYLPVCITRGADAGEMVS